MHFGASVREILTVSYGIDLRGAGPRTELPAFESTTALRALAANLEVAFGIALGPDDLAHLRTVRDVLQCVRLRLWEQRLAADGQQPAAGDRLPAARPTRARVSRPVFVPVSSNIRERFLRFAPRTGDRHSKRL